MNEDITEEIYFAMLDAGYTQEEAQKTCNTKEAKMLFEHAEQKAKEYKEKKLIENFEFFKDVLIDLANE